MKAIKELRRWYRLIKWRGKKVHCPICEKTFKAFMPTRGRKNAKCPNCFSLERHRLLTFFINDLLAKIYYPIVLHIGGHPAVINWFRKIPNIYYKHIDIDPRKVEHASLCSDISDPWIEYPSNKIDIIICIHVLEHVDKERIALRNIVNMLAPRGYVVLCVPMNGIDKTRTAPLWADESWCLYHFGQKDHRRFYGNDFVNRIESFGLHYKETHTNDNGDKIFVFRK